MIATISRTTDLAAPPAEVWHHATSLEHINREMGPWLAMTAPEAFRGQSLDDERVVLGEPLFESRVRLFGRLTVDRMALTIVELERGRRFVEESPMRSMRRWRHERSVTALEGGSRLCDHLSFEARIAAATPLLRLFVAAFFAHRHRRLVARFGAR